jgi:multicomponent Na+:H+ antiporter subunit D
MSGLGRAMPITFGAFLIGALSIIGLPPLGGSWSKWLLMMGAVDTGQMIIIAVLLVSSLLNVAYLMPIVGKGFFIRDNATAVPVKNLETSPFVWGPPVITALGCVVLFFFAGYIEAFLMPLGATN